MWSVAPMSTTRSVMRGPPPLLSNVYAWGFWRRGQYHFRKVDCFDSSGIVGEA
jgi:hypothetical protein